MVITSPCIHRMKIAISARKSFRALFVPDNLEVVVKLWDGYKSSGKKRNHKVEIYMHLQDLWRVRIPQLTCSADIDFCYGVILEDISVISHRIELCTDVLQGKRLSEQRIDNSIERGVVEAYTSIHDLGVIHGDVRPENVLSRKMDVFGSLTSRMLQLFLQMMLTSLSVRTMK